MVRFGLTLETLIRAVEELGVIQIRRTVEGNQYRAPTPEGLKPKDLVGVPWRVAFALQAQGWHLRSDIIWHKPNCQPESVKDRPTRAHEYLFLLSKSEKYYYDYEASSEPTKEGNGYKNKRTVWPINTEPFNGAHFAVFPFLSKTLHQYRK